jgi:S1-C subfamily serine protease
MITSVLIDLLVIAAVLGNLAYGLTIGLIRSLIVGAAMMVGLVASLALQFGLFSGVSNPDIRAIVSAAATFSLIGLGQIVGHLISKKARFSGASSVLWLVNRIAGGIALALIVAVTLAMMSHASGKFGVPQVTRAISGSVAVQILNNVMPQSAERKLFEVLSIFASQRVTVLPEDFGDTALKMPDFAGEDIPFSTAYKSVVRITGNAYACGQGRTGTGFVVAKDRIVTNAHILAGVTRPTIEAPNGQVLSGEVVYFSSRDDVAVIAVTGLDATALTAGVAAPTGERTKIVGYPHGGPIAATAAYVESVGVYNSPDIYRKGGSAREVYILSGAITPGISGAPVLDLDGDYVGMVFARATNQKNVGYAMTLDKFRTVVNNAVILSTPVSSGACITD